MPAKLKDASSATMTWRAGGRLLARTLRVVAPVALVVWIVVARPFEALPALDAASMWLICGALAVNFVVSLPIDVWRWRLASHDPPPFFHFYWAQLEAYATSAVLGMGVADFVRSARLRRRADAFLGDLGASLAEHLLRYVALGALLVAAGLWSTSFAVPAIIGGLGLGVFALAVVTRAWWLERLPDRRWATTLRSLGTALAPRRALTLFLLALLGSAVELAVLALCLWALGLGDADFPTFVARAAMTHLGINVAVAIPGPPAQLGTFEGGAVLALVATGVPADHALAFAVAYHALHVIPVTVVGAASFALRRSSRDAQP